MTTEHVKGLTTVTEVVRDVSNAMGLSFYESLLAGCDLPVEHQWELIELLSAQ